MRKLALIVLAIAVVFMLTSCGGYKWVKQATPTEDVKTAVAVEKEAEVAKGEKGTKKDQTLLNIMDELMDEGETVDRGVHGRTWIIPDGKGGYKEVSYSWERLVIKSKDGNDYHAIIFEFGQLRKIEPVKDVEDAKKRFKPYGGWKD